MAFCIHCGRELADGARFCANCGTSVVAEPEQDKSENQQKTVYDGRIHKCPNCGEQLDSFTATCPVCGYELRGTQVTSCVHELSQKLEKTDSLEKKIELISNFYIPNTKEDIYEFFILAYSKITAGAYGVDAWSVKLEQAYLKAKLAFNEGEDFKYIQELYDKINKATTKRKLFKSKNFKASVVLAIGLLMIIGGFTVPVIMELTDYESVPFWLIAFLGALPFIIGLIMLIIPERKKRQRV